MDAKSYVYKTSSQWVKRRRASFHVEGLPELTVSAPPEFKGEPGFWTPEHLLVAAAESCLMATFLGIAENSRITVGTYESRAEGRLEWVDGTGLRFSEVTIFPTVEVEKPEDLDRAQRVMEKASRGCLIANSSRAPVRVEPRLSAWQQPHKISTSAAQLETAWDSPAPCQAGALPSMKRCTSAH